MADTGIGRALAAEAIGTFALVFAGCGAIMVDAKTGALGQEFYCELFALEVAFREAETPEGWRTLPTQAAWEDAKPAGVELDLVMLYRDGFRLALEAVDRVSPQGLLSHVGVYADESELERLHPRAESAGCTIVPFDHARSLVIDDSFGVRWELNTFALDDPPSLSTGARTGLGLDV